MSAPCTAACQGCRTRWTGRYPPWCPRCGERVVRLLGPPPPVPGAVPGLPKLTGAVPIWSTCSYCGGRWSGLGACPTCTPYARRR